MLGLKLREEFLAAHMPGTAISLRTTDNQGAAQKSAEHILSITYPTADVQSGLKAISTRRSGRPIVLMGDRGRGKSHILAVMHHAINSPDIVERWIHGWGNRLNDDELRSFEIGKGYIAISEPVHNHEYPLLWNLIFDRHPKGDYYRGKFEQMDQPFPPRTLLEKMFEDQPICLILDEFQTWYTGLPEKDPKNGVPIRQWAFNFIQILSELSKDRPEILVFAISVLNNQNEAFDQVHRQGPVLIDFRGPTAKKDRQRLVLHRLFVNRANLADNDIARVADTYAKERFRLRYPDKSETERERSNQDVIGCWPFSPELLELLENHILLSQAAQETRDLIRILAQVYRSKGENSPIITPSDFSIDGESDEVQSLVDSIAVQVGQDKLRQIAQNNLQSVHDAGANVPHARELLSSIWVRSLSPGRNAGGTPTELHLDITRAAVIDDNAFQAEITTLIENSVNIHGDEVPGGPLWLGINENPRSKVRACAKNGKLWEPNAVPSGGRTTYPGKDLEHVRNTLKHVMVTDTRQPPTRVIVLGPNWKSNPWNEVEDADKPSKWDRPVLLVVPDQIQGGHAGINECLGPWLTKHVQTRRNTIRFLLPSSEAQGLFDDEELIYSARCSFLCSREAWGSDSLYRTLHQDFDRPLRNALKARYNRFAILKKWDFQNPSNCTFEIEKITQQSGEIASGVEAKILSDLFDPTEFKSFVLKRAKDSDFIGSLLDDLAEPPPPQTGEAIPFLGDTKVYEFILDIAAEGEIVLNVGGTWIGRRTEDATPEDARRYIQSKAFRSGEEMRKVQLALPGAVGGGTVTAAGPKPGVPTPGGAAQPGVSGGQPAQPGGSTGTPTGGQPTGGVTPTGAGAVGGGEGEITPIPVLIPHSFKTDESSTGINLSGCFEQWGVDSTQTIDSARIEFNGLTAQQVKQILQRIPSTFKAKLEIDYQEGGK